MLASAEWQPLNEQERAVVTALSQRLAGFDTVAPDLLLVFVRGYLTDGVWHDPTLTLILTLSLALTLRLTLTLTLTLTRCRHDRAAAERVPRVACAA